MQRIKYEEFYRRGRRGRRGGNKENDLAVGRRSAARSPWRSSGSNIPLQAFFIYVFFVVSYFFFSAFSASSAVKQLHLICRFAVS